MQNGCIAQAPLNRPPSGASTLRRLQPMVARGGAWARTRPGWVRAASRTLPALRHRSTASPNQGGLCSCLPRLGRQPCPGLRLQPIQEAGAEGSHSARHVSAPPALLARHDLHSWAEEEAWGGWVRRWEGCARTDRKKGKAGVGGRAQPALSPCLDLQEQLPHCEVRLYPHPAKEEQEPPPPSPASPRRCRRC